MRMPIYFRQILALCLIFSLQYPVTAQTTESATEEFKFCMSTCMSNSCSGPASVVEKKLQSKMFDKHKNHESHSSKSTKRMHTSRAALNRLLDENDTSQTLTTLASAAAALGKKVDLELLDQRSVLRQLIFSL